MTKIDQISQTHPQQAQLSLLFQAQYEKIHALHKSIIDSICQRTGLLLADLAQLDTTKFRNISDCPDYFVSLDGEQGLIMGVKFGHNLNFVSNHNTLLNTKILDRVCMVAGIGIPGSAEDGVFIRYNAMSAITIRDDLVDQTKPREYLLGLGRSEIPGKISQFKNMPILDLTKVENALNMTFAVFRGNIEKLFMET